MRGQPGSESCNSPDTFNCHNSNRYTSSTPRSELDVQWQAAYTYHGVVGKFAGAHQALRRQRTNASTTASETDKEAGDGAG